MTAAAARPRVPCPPVAADLVIASTAGVAGVAMAANWWSRVATGDRARRLELWSKPLATVAIGTLGLLVAGDDVSTAALVAAAVGFVLCLGGDVALMPVVDRFVVGLASFLAGHLAFVVMFVLLGLDRWWLGLLALVLAVGVAALLGRPIVAGAQRQDPGLVRPVQAYLTIISSMAVVGWATGRPAAIAGSALFVASDSVLGWRQFVAERRWMSLVVMVTYHGALIGLALSLAG